jgi:hypothetical protein
MPNSGPFSYARVVRFDVAEEKDILLALQRQWIPETARARPTAPERIEHTIEHRLEVSVVFTSAPATTAAIRKAAALAESLGARITLIVAQVVPYPWPLESPAVPMDFSERRLFEMAEESPVETRVRIYLCRDQLRTLKALLAPRSLIVIGGRKRWWPTREKALARQLRRAGHEIVFWDAEVGMNA